VEGLASKHLLIKLLEACISTSVRIT
jgi:hypothetical protein